MFLQFQIEGIFTCAAQKAQESACLYQNSSSYT